jgi:hypothetical protein
MSSNDHELMTERGASLPPESPPELRAFLFHLMAYVPKGTDQQILAQQLADQIHTITRASTGETYRAAADVFVIPEPELPDPAAPDQDTLQMLVYAWAKRPWQQNGEWRNFAFDLHEAAKSWLLTQYPAPYRQPIMMPLRPKAADKLAGMGDHVAHTSGDLPPGWAGPIADYRLRTRTQLPD